MGLAFDTGTCSSDGKLDARRDFDQATQTTPRCGGRRDDPVSCSYVAEGTKTGVVVSARLALARVEIDPHAIHRWPQSTHAGRSMSQISGDDMALERMDNVGIVVESLDAAISFFVELGLRLEGRATIEGEWAGRLTGLGAQHVEIAMLVTPDGHSRIELSRFLAPPVVADHRNAPVNALGYLRVMFTVDDIDETLVRLRERGAQLVGDVVQYEESYRLCYIRGPEGLLIGLAEELR
jgi:catechol 2,3-dioxygenase-like lactoylglutathione lyase family enzyme